VEQLKTSPILLYSQTELTVFRLFSISSPGRDVVRWVHESDEVALTTEPCLSVGAKISQNFQLVIILVMLGFAWSSSRSLSTPYIYLISSSIL